MAERLFTATEVQAALVAVILYERTRTERLLRGASAAFDEAIRANRRTLSKKTHKRIEDIITEAYFMPPLTRLEEER